MPDLDLDKIARLAGSAWAGPWHVGVEEGETFPIVEDDEGTPVAWDVHNRNAEFIAACSPDVVLALVRRIRELEEAARNIRDNIATPGPDPEWKLRVAHNSLAVVLKDAGSVRER